MAFGKQELIALYRKRARHYDLSANLYYLIGFREAHFRKMAVDSLGLGPGDAVLEIGCGTGLNFSLLRDAVGPDGRIIGLDLTDRMLARAQRRIEANRWRNVELIKADAAEFAFPSGLNGILSTFALTLIPEYEQLIERGSRALAGGGRFAVLDFKKPDNRPLCFTRALVLLSRPFGVTLDLADRHPWEAMEKYFAQSSYRELYFGFSYLSVGKRENGRE